MLIILFVQSGCQIPICSLLRSFALHLAPAALALHILKFGNLKLPLSGYSNVYQALTLHLILRLTISNRPSNPLNAFLLAPQIRLC